MSPARSFILACAFAPLALAALPGDAVAKGPPWISIELPANPYDRTTRGAFLLVHAFHHGTPMGFPVSGKAEGLVNGVRRTIQLTFERTERTGVYSLRKQWADEGEWTLVISVTQGKGENNAAHAMVRISAGEVIAVRVPTEQRGDWTVPRRISQAEIEASLREPLVRVARRGN